MIPEDKKKIYTIVKGRETFYRRLTVPVTSPSPFSSREDITVDLKRVDKLLDGLNVHKASGLDELNARVLKECGNAISPILAPNKLAHIERVQL